MFIADYVSENYGRCIRWAKACLPPSFRQDAEDVVVETYLKLRNNKTVIRPETAQTYIFTAIKHKAIDHMRTVANHERLENDHEKVIRMQVFNNGDRADPSDIVGALNEVEDRMDLLSPLLRSTLEDVLIEGMQPEEVAEQEDVSADVIYKRIERAKKTLLGD